LLTKNREIGLDFGNGDGVLSKAFLPSAEVVFVTDDAGVEVGVQQAAKADVVAALLKDIQRNPALTLIVGLLVILLLKEHLEFLARDSEHARIRHRLLVLLELAEKGSPIINEQILITQSICL